MATVSNRPYDTKFFGHPFGLATLFFTEMWERFSFYGMRTLLALFMTADIAKGGFGFSVEKATSIQGTYAMGIYMTPILGGFIADRLLGARRSVLIGGIIIACGHFCMLLNTVPTFYLGLCLIVAGTGLLKPNASTMVGDLYDKDDERRDAGFSIFYMGINLGAFIGPIITSPLGQKIAWHYGFAAAGFGMVLGIIQYVAGAKYLGTAGQFKKKEKNTSNVAAIKQPLTRDEITRLIAICILVVFSTVFFMGFEQQGTSMNLFSDRLVNWHIFGFNLPSGLNQSIEPVFVITLAPVLAWIWIKMKNKQPSSPVKFALGLFFLGIGNVVMVFASAMTAAGKVTVMWLVVSFFLIAIGELCLSPVGLSTVSQLAPARFVGFMMGVWFLSISVGNKLAGMVAGTFDDKNRSSLYKLFGGLAIEVVLAGVILLLMTPFIKRLMAQRNPTEA